MMMRVQKLNSPGIMQLNFSNFCIERSITCKNMEDNQKRKFALIKLYEIFVLAK